mgnify:CR=1 FL=1
MNIKSMFPMLLASMGVSLVMAATDMDASMEHEGQVKTTVDQHSGHNMDTMADDHKQNDHSSQDQDSGRIIPQFSLQNGAGKLVSEADFADSYLLVSFGFTHCPYTCPTILSNWAKVMAELPVAMAERLVPILITVDPERDTPQMMEDYVRKFDERFVGLSGSTEQVAAAAKNFRVSYEKVGAGSDYMIQHTGFNYLISPQRELVAVFRSGTSPEQMTQVIRRLLK